MIHHGWTPPSPWHKRWAKTDSLYAFLSHSWGICGIDRNSIYSVYLWIIWSGAKLAQNSSSFHQSKESWCLRACRPLPFIWVPHVILHKILSFKPMIFFFGSITTGDKFELLLFTWHILAPWIVLEAMFGVLDWACSTNTSWPSNTRYRRTSQRSHISFCAVPGVAGLAVMPADRSQQNCIYSLVGGNYEIMSC